MTMYDVRYQKEALDDLVKLKRQEPAAFKKAVKLIDELYEHPKTGTGKPEPLATELVSGRAALRKSIVWCMKSVIRRSL